MMTVVLMLLSLALNGQTVVDSSITYIHAKKPSFTSKVIQSTASLLGIKKGKALIKKANRPGASEAPAKIPRSIRKNYDIQESIADNRKTWILKPKKDASDKVVIFLHGGAYIMNIHRLHWRFIEDLLIRTNATIVVPDYPLAPASNCEHTIDYLSRLYQELLLTHSSADIVVAGDSAGAGLALGFAMTLRDEKKPQPSQIILLSPWLDITMSNRDISEFDKRDKILGIKPLQKAGIVYAGNLDLKDYRLSPIFGDLEGLGKISVFIGTHDLFIADCRKLKQLAETSGIAINYFEYPEMFHDWFIVPGMAEAKLAVQQISSLIKAE